MTYKTKIQNEKSIYYFVQHLHFQVSDFLLVQIF